MRTNLIVVDDFYQNPDALREFALSQDFSVTGNYPGLRTRSFLSEDCINIINNLLTYSAGGVTNWLLDENSDGYTGSFQLCTSQDRTWIHTDQHNTWAGVCYLTPNAPVSGGTAIYKHKRSGERTFTQDSPFEKDPYDYTEWEIVDRIGNIYNRLVLFRGDLYHASVDYFGNNANNGRLFQLFFFNTAY